MNTARQHCCAIKIDQMHLYVAVNKESLINRQTVSHLCLLFEIFVKLHKYPARDCSLARLHSSVLAVVRCPAGCLSVTFVYCVKTAEDTATVAMEFDSETVPKLQNGTVSSDLELPLNYISRFQRQTQSRGLSATAELLVLGVICKNKSECFCWIKV